MKYDAILVLGRGIRKDGSIPESAIASVDKAVELLKNDLADFIIFSGKWSYQFDYTPPTTEAAAMASYAITLGTDSKKIFIEDRSITTVTNVIYTKRNFLIPRKLYNIAVIYTDPFRERMKINLSKVLGPKFTFDLIKSDFLYPKEKLEALQQSEKSKQKEALKFLNQFEDGDDTTIEIESLKEISINPN